MWETSTKINVAKGGIRRMNDTKIIPGDVVVLRKALRIAAKELLEAWDWHAPTMTDAEKEIWFTDSVDSWIAEALNE